VNRVPDERVTARADLLRREQEATREALAGIADVLAPGRGRAAGGDPLTRAFEAVARSLSIAPVERGPGAPPASATDRLQSLARTWGVRLRRVALRGEWWRRDGGALLAYGQADGRPLALLVDRSGRYRCYDPSDDSRRLVTRRVARGIARGAVAPYRALPVGRLGLRDLFAFALARRRREIVLALWTGLAATGLGMITPQATALLMDHAIPDADRRALFEIGAGLIAATLGVAIFRLSQGIVLLRLGLASEAETQAAVWDRLLRLRPSFLRGYSSGDLQSRTTAIQEIGHQASGVLLSTIFASSLALLNFFLLVHYSPRLSLVALAVAALVAAFLFLAGLLVSRLLRRLLDVEGRFFGWVVQLVDGVAKLRVAGAEERAFQNWARRYAQRLRLDDAVTRWRDRVQILSRALPATSSGLLFLIAHGSLVGSEEPDAMTLGTFLAFTVAFSVFLSGATSLSEAVVSVLDLAARARRVAPLLEERPEVDERRSDPGRLGGRLALEAVHFRYASDAPPVLRAVDLHADPGEFVAVVGPSGSGKSTLLRLLLGFERPTAGRVTYDGKDLESLDVGAVRGQLGVVLQDGRLDAGTILDNIAGGASLDLDQAWAAARAAGLAEDIQEMPMGLHTILGVGGGTVSGGQRQRLLIARALARRPRIALFDEATSSLDNRAQAVVAQSLSSLEVTRVVIAHRLSTIRGADRIYVLDAGRVVQVGTFAELAAQEGGLFASMMSRQLA